MRETKEMLTEGEIQRLADRYRIRLDVLSSAGILGSLEGRETGASVEIQDFRDYVPGDDPRRIDWFSYGRTGNLIVRLFREEVSPFFDVIVDTSRSMAIQDGRKGPLAHELCRWLFLSSRTAGVAIRLFHAGTSLSRLEGPEQIHFTEPECVLFTAPRRATAGCRRSSVRMVISDFMSPSGAGEAVKALAGGCTRLLTVHLLGPWEAEPDPKGPAMLDAVEQAEQADITLDRRTVEDYSRRLGVLKNEIREEVFKCGGLHMEIVADQDLESVLRCTMLPLGLVEVF